MTTEHFHNEPHPEEGFEISRGDDVAPVFGDPMIEGHDDAGAEVESTVAKVKKKPAISPQVFRLIMIAVIALVFGLAFLAWKAMTHRKPAAVPMLVQKLTPPGDVVNGQPGMVTGGPVEAMPTTMMPPSVTMPESTVITAPGATVTQSTPTTPAATTTAVTPPLQVSAESPQAVAGMSAAQADALNSRMAALESKLAGLEVRRSASTSSETHAAVQHSRPAAETAAPKKRVAKVRHEDAEAPVIERPRPTLVAVAPVVRVIGGTSRSGVVSVLVDVGGAKRNVVPGDQISGIGRVDETGLDGENAYVKINGSTFR